MEHSEIVAMTVDAVRKACVEQEITQGAIGVTFAYPNKEQESYVEPVVEGGDTIGRDADGKELGDCADVVAAKVAGTLKSIEYYTAEKPYPGRDKYTSGALPEQFVGEGITNWKGGIGIPIGRFIGGGCGGCCHRGVLNFIIVVAVSGGKQEQDEAAAWAALGVIREITDKGPSLMLARDFWEKYDEVNGEVDRYVEPNEGQ